MTSTSRCLITVAVHTCKDGLQSDVPISNAKAVQTKITRSPYRMNPPRVDSLQSFHKDIAIHIVAQSDRKLVPGYECGRRCEESEIASWASVLFIVSFLRETIFQNRFGEYMSTGKSDQQSTITRQIIKPDLELHPPVH